MEAFRSLASELRSASHGSRPLSEDPDIALAGCGGCRYVQVHMSYGQNSLQGDSIGIYGAVSPCR